MMAWWSMIGSGVLDLIYPAKCAACAKTLKPTETEICLKCLIALPATGLPFSSDNAVAEQLHSLGFQGKVHCLWYYNQGNLCRELIHNIKYVKRPYAAQVAGSILAREIELSDDAVLVPIPMQAEKLRQRGYNQALEIAKGIAKVSGLPIDDGILVKKNKTISQTKLSKEKRLTNAKRVFQLSDGASVNGKNFVLVDDVLTTGATLMSAAEVLLNAGAKNVDILTLAWDA